MRVASTVLDLDDPRAWKTAEQMADCSVALTAVETDEHSAG